MKTHVTLVNPPYPAGSSQHPPCPSVGLGYLAAVLEKKQYKVDVIDYLILGAQRRDFRNRIGELRAHGFRLAVLIPGGATYEDFRKEISKRQPDIVGITSTVLTYKSALKIAEIAKKVRPNCLTVLGGPHATFWDEEALQECPYLDVVVRKEGENMDELTFDHEKFREYHRQRGLKILAPEPPVKGRITKVDILAIAIPGVVGGFVGFMVGVLAMTFF